MAENPATWLLRRVLSGSPSVSGGIAGTPIIPASQVGFYFQLGIAEEGAADLGRAPAGRKVAAAETLRRGRRYTVTVVPRTYGAREEVSVQVASGSWFELVYSEPSGVGIVAPRYQLAGPPRLDALSWSFVVEVPRDGPMEEGEFQLFSLRAGDGGGRVCVARLPVLLDGFGEQEWVMLGAAYVTTARPPAGTAILHITREGEGQVRLRGGADWPDSGWRWLESIVMEAPPANLGELVTWRVNPAVVTQLMGEYSRADTVPLQAWLSNLLEMYQGGELKLVICDYTDFGTPWEMLTLALADKRVVWLGAEAAVSRWVPVTFYQHTRHLDFSLEPPEGGALVYIDEQELRGVAEELAAVEALSLTRCPSLKELRAALKGSLADLALVYLASHGTFSTAGLMDVLAGAIALGSEHDPENRITVLEFEGLLWHDDPRPLVFVNACHSARVFRSSRLSVSLPEVLLSQVAGAYIGTLGPVGSDYASEVAGRFLRLAAGQEGVLPARFLRELRAEAVAVLREEETLENWKRVVFAFSYVMYGNPMAQLRLRPPRDGGGP